MIQKNTKSLFISSNDQDSQNKMNTEKQVNVPRKCMVSCDDDTLYELKLKAIRELLKKYHDLFHTYGKLN